MSKVQSAASKNMRNFDLTSVSALTAKSRDWIKGLSTGQSPARVYRGPSDLSVMIDHLPGDWQRL